jgi:RNA polymerase sigma-70 factor (ECF subfamily)
VESKLFDDRELCRRIAMGDGECFGEWYQDSAPRLRTFLRKLLGNEQAAEDVMQETFIQIWRRPTGFDSERGTLRAYLFGTARNLALSWNRKQKPTDELEGDPKIATSAESTSIMADAMNRLEPDERTLLWLREVEGQSYSELATIFNIPIGTVRSRLYSAREALRAVWHNAQCKGRPQ